MLSRAGTTEHSGDPRAMIGEDRCQLCIVAEQRGGHAGGELGERQACRVEHPARAFPCSASTMPAASSRVAECRDPPAISLSGSVRAAVSALHEFRAAPADGSTNGLTAANMGS